MARIHDRRTGKIVDTSNGKTENLKKFSLKKGNQHCLDCLGSTAPKGFQDMTRAPGVTRDIECSTCNGTGQVPESHVYRD